MAEAVAPCAACGQSSKYKCSRCAIVRYCSKQCQKDNWPVHKLRCEYAVEAEARIKEDYAGLESSKAAMASMPAMSVATLKARLRGMSPNELLEALHVAIQGGHADLVDACLQLGVDASATWGDSDANSLHVACLAGNPQILKKCIDSLKRRDRDRALNAGDAAGFTPLIHAADLVDASCIQVLLDCPEVEVKKRMMLPAGIPNAAKMDHSTALHIAAFRGADGVRLLLAKGAKVNAKSKAGYTPLRNAVERDRHDDAAGVRLLMEAGADASIRNDVGETAVHAAVSAANGAPLSLQALLDFDADITPVKVRMNPGEATSFDERKHPWFTYLHSAAQHNMADVLRMVFSHAKRKGIRLDPNVLDSEKLTPLHWIVMKNTPTGQRQSTKVLLEYGASPLLVTSSAGSAVAGCIRYFRPDIFEVFAEHGVDISEVTMDGVPLLQHLARCYVDCKVMDMPIPSAIFAGRMGGPKKSAVYQQLIKTAIKARASIPEGKSEPINLAHVVAEGGDAETMQELLKTDAGRRLVVAPVGEGVTDEFSLPGWTCLHLAVDNKNAAGVMRALLDGGAVAVVNTEDADGMTPLHRAVACAAPHEVMKLVKLLMAAGATPSTKNNAGVHVQHTVAERFETDPDTVSALTTLLSGASI